METDELSGVLNSVP